jgi:hypothetical protein
VDEKSAPIIVSPSLTLRRLVISENCEGSNYREIAYVEGDASSEKEYFTYYFEVSSPVRTWYYLGMKNKLQPSQVYSNPYAYPIYVSDPSFILYPASLFFEQGIKTLFASKLSTTDQQIFNGLTPVASSEKDRLMGKISRFAVDGVAPNNSKYRMTGWQISSLPQGFTEDSQMISMVCQKSMITENYVIGNTNTVSPTTPSASSSTSPTGEIPVTTEISTNILGGQTVVTTNVETLLNEDKILKSILEWLISKRPVTNNYELLKIEISEYNLALEYRLVMTEKNVNGNPSFVPKSELRAVIVHDKATH